MQKIGLGYDIHKLVEGRDLIIGGVKIPFNKGLLGHSDADVLTHAVIDAVFGALALKDIGTHFPDTDENYKDVSSLMLLEKTAQITAENGYKIINVDSNVIAQAPKLAPYIDEMRKNIAKALKTDISSISVKAKTKEQLDSVGEGRAIEANAIALLERI